MASFQSEIELRVKVVDKEIKELEQRVQKIQNPFSASGASKGASKAELRARQTLLNVDKNRLDLQIKYKADQIKQLNITNSWLKVLRQGEEVRKDIARAAEREAKATQKTAAATKRTADRKRKQGLQSAALGVGFPLLFGGGAGSIAGGLLGSAGGFGGQILGSALGQQIDNAVQGIAKLGQALNPLTADLDAITKAAGITGSKTEGLIKQLEDLGNAEAALEAATAELAVLVGQEGVDALKEFGADSVEFGNEVSRALTVVGASIASIINAAGILKGITDALAFDTDLKRGIANRNNDAELGRLYNERGNPDLARLDADATEVQNIIRGLDEAIVARQRQLDIEKQITLQQKTQEEIQAQIQANNAPELADLQAQLELKESELDLTTQVGLQAALAAKRKQLDAKVQGEIEKGVSKEVLQLRRKLALLDIVNQYKEEQRRKDEQDRREAEEAQRKEEQRKKKLNTAAISLIDTAVKVQELDKGRIAAIDEELRFLARKQGFIEYNIQLSEKDLQVQNILLDVARQKMSIKERELQLERARIQLAQQSQIESISRSGEDFRRGITNEGAGIALGLQDPFGTSQQVQEQVLALEQMERRTAALLPLQRKRNDLIKEGIALQGLESQQARDNRSAQINALDAEINKNAQALAGLEQLELAQSRYNQVLQAAQPYAEAFATGLTQGLLDVVRGTKTAEEAFADFLNNIADMLMQTAATMIAQYIAIGIAKAFAGLGGGSSGSGFSQFGTNSTGVSTNFIGSGLSGFAGLAEGGYVTGPTPALVGEGGESEYVIPASKMSSSLAKYSAGARGDQVLDNSGPATSGGVAVADAPTEINISGGVMQFGGEEFIRKDQLPSIVAQASKAGEARTMRRLQMSPSSRSRVGL